MTLAHIMWLQAGAAEMALMAALTVTGQPLPTELSDR